MALSSGGHADSDSSISPRHTEITIASSDEPSPLLKPEDIQLPASPPFDTSLPSSPTRPRPQLPLRGGSEPVISSLPSPKTFQLPLRPRTQSPSRPQARPHTSGGAPLMQRAHSSPGVDSSGRFITPPYAPRRPTSPLHTGRRRSPLRSAMEESYPGALFRGGLNIEPNIPENEELEFGDEFQHSSPLPSYTNTFPRSRRRPQSPLHQSASAPSLHAKTASPSTSRSASPSISYSRYANEPYPNYSFSSASSMPSTPTSTRSRSPSISSLETIEDTPDAEEAALMEEEEAKQKGEDSDGGAELRRRSSLEIRANGLRSNKERKRWSVCGAERRADFSLEPIEE
jgi:hypothetical protein